jgi:hypothetical protein
MREGIKPIRRVVTGNDAQGRSCVLYDSAAPNVNANQFEGHGHDGYLGVRKMSAPLSGTR